MPLMPTQNTQRTSRRRPLLLALVAAAAMLAGLLGPLPGAQAADAKPVVKVAGISGANGLRVSWNAIRNTSGSGNVATFKVWYGTSSSRSKAKSKNINIASNRNSRKNADSPAVVLTELSLGKTYYVWVQPYNASFSKATGPVSNAAKGKVASKLAYKPPVSVSVVNVGKDSAEVVFRTVTGAPTYLIRAVPTGGGKTVYSSTGAEGSWVITGLSSKKKYKFTVAVELPWTTTNPGYVRMSGFSKASATATTNPGSYLDAPRDIALRDDPTSDLDKDGQRPDSVDLQWTAPAGFDPAIHIFQVDYASNQAMSGKGYRRVNGTNLGAPTDSSRTSTDVSGQPVEAPADETASEPPVEPLPDVETTAPQVSPEPGDTPAPSDTPTPGDTTTPSGSPTPTGSVTPSQSATPDQAPAPTETATTDDTESDVAQAAAVEGDAPRVVLLGAPAAANRSPQVYWARIAKLPANANLFLRVRIIKKSGLAQVSERSDAIMVKTLSPKGYITGRVTVPGGSGGTVNDWVVAAYRGADMHDQVSLNRDGSYKLSVRPGAYYVQAIYIGNGNFNSRWAASPNTAGRSRNDPGGKASKITVSVGKAVGAPTIVPQSTPSYVIKGDVNCPGAPSGKCSVDVAALGANGTVIKQDRSNENGGFTIQGLPAGGYTLRVSHSEERYNTREVKASVSADTPVATKRIDLQNRRWVAKYATKISGTKKVGKTLKVSSKAWIASELPVVRAVQKCQWQRNGANISGATKCSYKLTRADRGKSIRVRVVNYRYGFESNRSFSKAYRVG